ncbi:hypothetical protein ACIBHX_23400 [Nonomuraea sp. NPDC050536]
MSGLFRTAEAAIADRKASAAWADAERPRPTRNSFMRGITFFLIALEAR